MSEELKSLMDGAAMGTAVIGGLLVSNLNTTVLLVTLVWTALRIWETDTVQSLFKRKEGDTDA